MLIHELIYQGANAHPASRALTYKDITLSYAELAAAVEAAARGYRAAGLERMDRVAVYLEKRCETVAAQFGAAAAGGVFVPINPVLKARQVAHILHGSGARFLVTSPARLETLSEIIPACPDLATIILLDDDGHDAKAALNALSWTAFIAAGKAAGVQPARVIDEDPTAILFTSGSTGMPKGVVLSHRNMVASAKSASTHLYNNADDRILCILPFSFDYGLVQLTSAFNVGASVALMNYLFPRDVIRTVLNDGITGLAGVPPLWIQLMQADWPAEATDQLRYVTNSGGRLPVAVQKKIRSVLPRTDLYLMYGLTEAFRSTCLPASEVDRRPTSIGKPIPNADLLVVRPDGTPCQPNEQGELIHRGAFVSKGYWNDPVRTAERFRPLPNQPERLPITEIAVWSGDIVWFDEDGFFYFIGRRDEQIKTSGYRVSPTEIEEMLYETNMIAEAVVFGVDHPDLGQAPVAVVTSRDGKPVDVDGLLKRVGENAPRYMVPSLVIQKPSLPRTPNGKMDRRGIADEYLNVFEPASKPAQERPQDAAGRLKVEQVSGQ